MSPFRVQPWASYHIHMPPSPNSICTGSSWEGHRLGLESHWPFVGQLWYFRPRANGLGEKKNIYFANSKNNYNTNIMCRHRAGFPEGQSPIVLDTLSNAEYNIKYLKKVYHYYRSMLVNIHLYTNVIKKYFFTYYTQHKGII